MVSGSELSKDALVEFVTIQEPMLLAKEEGAVRTYESLLRRYRLLKAILMSQSVNLEPIDQIKE